MPSWIKRVGVAAGPTALKTRVAMAPCSDSAGVRARRSTASPATSQRALSWFGMFGAQLRGRPGLLTHQERAIGVLSGLPTHGLDDLADHQRGRCFDAFEARQR